MQLKLRRCKDKDAIEDAPELSNGKSSAVADVRCGSKTALTILKSNFRNSATELRTSRIGSFVPEAEMKHQPPALAKG